MIRVKLAEVECKWKCDSKQLLYTDIFYIGVELFCAYCKTSGSKI